ncbi:MAG: isoprenyl transferase [Syntrophomonadaceae bacterium]
MLLNKDGILLEHNSLPTHIAIIMDGNGRWARRRLLPRTVGHRAGMAALKRVVKACDELHIAVLTVYAFSTENWKRPEGEVQFLMKLLVEFLHKELTELNDNNVRINILGDYSVLNQECQYEIKKALDLTQTNTGLLLNIALNYGSRVEIIDAVKKLVAKVYKGELALNSISEDIFNSLLYTAGLPDPDLLIRTAGEMRLSNFLLWQLAYTEIWVTDCLWPDFGREDLLKALSDFQKRERRFGALSKLEEDGEGV